LYFIVNFRFSQHLIINFHKLNSFILLMTDTTPMLSRYRLSLHSLLQQLLPARASTCTALLLGVCALTGLTAYLGEVSFFSELSVLELVLGGLVLLLWVRDFCRQQALHKRCEETSQAQQEASNQHELRRNQQRFLSMLMHEIRTPLSVIKIGVDAITQATPAAKDKHTWVQRIDVAIDNITQVIENCVQAEKHDAGLIQPSISRFIVEQELADMTSQIMAANAEFASRIHVEMDGQTGHWLETDRHYLRSILMNLISNALKYSPPFTPVFLRIHKIYADNGHQLKFEIENTLGKAGAPDSKHLFERYYRAEAAKKFAGTGLGLWLSQTLAKQLGTRIDMTLSLQQTVIFHFNLPLLQHA
jgi:signal transduction histidine kinase